MRPFTVLTLAVLLGFGLERQKAAEAIQLRFSAEDFQVRNPNLLPKPVLAALAGDEGVHQQMGSHPLPPAEWFSATKLISISDHEDLYLVEAEGQLRGANVTSFWLVRNDTISVQAKTMWTAVAHDVQLCYRKKDPYPDISALKFTAEMSWGAVFHFDKDHYAMAYVRQGKVPADLPLPYCPLQSH
jgi:hypothetical protein